MSDPRKRNSAAMTDGPARAPARSQLKSIGFSDEDLARPIVGVAHEWIETMPCNFNHRRMAQRVKEGVRAAGGTPMEINTISVSDGVSMGTEGMRASLVSREVITDSIEVAAIGHSFDALVVIVGCDKTIPAGAMALARLNIPGLALYSGSIAPGKFRGQDITIQEVFEGVGAHAAGKLTADELMEIENAACPGAGACGGQFTANTMATALDFLGISPPGANVVPAMDGGKADTAFEAGRLVMDLLDRNVRPRDIITRESVENAISAVAATGGSTNAVLHLMAIAHEAGVDLELEDFDRIASRVPILADLKPWGNYVATDVFEAGGLSLVARELLKLGLLHGEERYVDGRTMADVAAAAQETPGQQVIYPAENPLKPTGGILILRGNLAPDGCVIKVSGQARNTFTGPARVFDGEEACFQAVIDQDIEAGSFIVIRNEGPAGGPGMREMLAVTGALQGAGYGRLGGADDRRPLLRRLPRFHDRPCRARSLPPRPHRRRPRRRPDHLRRGQTPPGRTSDRRANRGTSGRLAASGPALPEGRHGQIRRPRLLRQPGSRHHRLTPLTVHRGPGCAQPGTLCGRVEPDSRLTHSHPPSAETGSPARVACDLHEGVHC